MFSTLLGPLPIDPVGDPDGTATTDDHLEDVAALAATGLELVSDGREPASPDDESAAVVLRWHAAAAAVATPVKAVLLGPWSATRAGGTPEAAAERLAATVRALASAGCAFVEIAERDALEIATDPRAAAAFRQAHGRLIDGDEGIHASLALTGGNFDGAASATFYDLAYASYAFDLIAGPDNWRLVVEAPMDRGIVCGALGLEAGANETREVLVWAAHYAASTNGRGTARVGLANAPLAAGAVVPPRAEILRRLSLVAEASRIAGVDSSEELAELLDRRALDPRAMSGGRFDPARRRRR